MAGGALQSPPWHLTDAAVAGEHYDISLFSKEIVIVRLLMVDCLSGNEVDEFLPAFI